MITQRRIAHVILAVTLVVIAVYTAPPVTEVRSLIWCTAGWLIIGSASVLLAAWGSRWSSWARVATFAASILLADLVWSRPTWSDMLVVGTIATAALWITAEQRRYPIIQYLYLGRFPLAILLVFLALGPICQWGVPSFLDNLLVLRWVPLACVTALALVVAKALALALDVTLRHGQARNDLSPWPQAMRVTGFFVRTIASDLFALPLVAFLVYRSDDYWGWRPLIGAASGFVVGRVFLWLARALVAYLGPPSGPESAAMPHADQGLMSRAREVRLAWAASARHSAEHTFAARAQDIRAGYVDADGRLLPGHLTAWSFAALTLICYACGYGLSFPGATRLAVGGAWEIPAIAYVLLLLLLLTWMLTAAAFFLDRFRVSTLAALVFIPFALFFLHDIDFYYELPRHDTHAQAAGPVAVASTEAAERHDIRTALQNRMAHAMKGHGGSNGAPKPIVVVAASGGGITAAYWTAQVLAGLQTDFKAGFVDNIHLISAVSGGSAGAMFYVNGFGPDRYPNQSTVIDQAGQSSLSAVAWGFAYPDFWRNFAMRSPKDKRIDRGWALEQAWAANLGAQPTLSDWRSGTLDGWRPAVVFNATVAETGQRLVFSNLRLNTIPPECMDASPSRVMTCDDAIDAATAWSLYPDYDLPVVRAARLSAAFPFVSPIARPLMAEHQDRAYHVADGGYYDNFGIVTVVEWLRNVADLWSKSSPAVAATRPTILLIEIRESDYRERDARAAAERAGWTYAFTGPLATMLEVRRSSQAARNDLDLRLFQESVRSLGWTVKRAVFVLRADAPMSWQLSQRERDDIWAQWSMCRSSPATLVGRAYAEVATAMGVSYAHDGNINPRCALSPTTVSAIDTLQRSVTAVGRALR